MLSIDVIIGKGKPCIAGLIPLPYMVSKGLTHATPQDVIFGILIPLWLGNLVTIMNLLGVHPVAELKARWDFFLHRPWGQDSRFIFFVSFIGAISKNNFTILPLPQQHSFLSRVWISMNSFPLLSLTVSGTARSLSGEKVGSVQPPHLAIPITVELSKPTMCHDERF